MKCSFMYLISVCPAATIDITLYVSPALWGGGYYCMCDILVF